MIIDVNIIYCTCELMAKKGKFLNERGRDEKAGIRKEHKR